jgi:lipoprotein-anchoring transpeptidase ErfK/SrfK
MRRHHTSARRKGSLGKFFLLVLLVLAVVGGAQYFRGGWPFSAFSVTPSQPETIDAEPQLLETPGAIPDVAQVPLPGEGDDEALRQNLEKAVPSLEKVPEETMWIRIVKSRHTMYVYDGGALLRSYPIAVGENTGDKQKVGDRRTPEGTFTVQQMQKADYWVHDFGDGKGPIEGAYGPWFIRLRAGPWKGIGIHGTHDPSSIGKNVTEGCIRLTNEDLRELKPKITLGMKVVIEP